MKITIPVEVEAPTPAQVTDWLVRHRWVPTGRMGGAFAEFTGPDATIEIPARPEALDYRRLLTIAILDVAEIVGIEPADLVAQMREGR